MLFTATPNSQAWIARANHVPVDTCLQAADLFLGWYPIAMAGGQRCSQLIYECLGMDFVTLSQYMSILHGVPEIKMVYRDVSCFHCLPLPPNADFRLIQRSEPNPAFCKSVCNISVLVAKLQVFRTSQCTGEKPKSRAVPWLKALQNENWGQDSNHGDFDI